MRQSEEGMIAGAIQNPHLDSSPFFFEGGSSGVLLMHGFTATPVEVKLIGKYLHERGCTVSGPLLPGHGTTIEAINACSWRDWVDHAARAYAELTARCERVFVGGESLGGLLSLYLGSAHPEIAGLILYAPALRIASPLVHLSPLFKFLIKALPKRREENDPDSAVNQRWNGYTVDPVPAVAQVLPLQRQVRRRLPLIKQPIIIFQGRLDHTLKHSGAREIVATVQSADKELVWQEGSSHCIVLDVEWEEVAEKTLAFIQRIAG
jgi:carboxylesterase